GNSKAITPPDKARTIGRSVEVGGSPGKEGSKVPSFARIDGGRGMARSVTGISSDIPEEFDKSGGSSGAWASSGTWTSYSIDASLEASALVSAKMSQGPLSRP
ncbi:unnamed protein product, partial [Ilex paraguariensis]